MVFPSTSFLIVSLREQLTGASLHSGIRSSARFSLNSCTQCGNSDNGSSRARSLSSCLSFFLFLVSSGDRSPCAFSHILSLRIVAGRFVEFTVSCVNDVGDVGEVELDEPVANPGATSGTYCCVRHCILLPFIVRCGS